MSFRRPTIKLDKNDPVIKTALERDGCLVERIHGSKGLPDWLVWSPFLSCLVLIEIKDGERAKLEKRRGTKLAKEQAEFHARWKAAGALVFKVDSVEQARKAVGAKR